MDCFIFDSSTHRVQHNLNHLNNFVLKISNELPKSVHESPRSLFILYFIARKKPSKIVELQKYFLKWMWTFDRLLMFVINLRKLVDVLLLEHG